MIAVGLLCAGIAVALGAWIGQRLLLQATQRFRNRFTQYTHTGLTDLFVFIDLRHLWPTLLCTAGGLTLLCWLLTQSLTMSFVVGALTVVLPRIALTYAIRARQSKFDRQLPDLLLTLAGALRAGSSLSSALKNILQDAVAPLSQEFGLVLREQRMGVPLVRALDNLYSRMPSESVELVTTMFAIGTHSGGSLADLLERVCENLRARQHIATKIQVMTTQGKMQAWIIGLLPLVLLLVLSQIDPSSTRLMFESGVGRSVLLLVLVLESLGIYCLRRILTIHV